MNTVPFGSLFDYSPRRSKHFSARRLRAIARNRNRLGKRGEHLSARKQRVIARNRKRIANGGRS